MDRRMILRYVVYCSLLCNVVADSLRYDVYNWKENPKDAKCLTGYMTDVQKWVDKEGHLINVNRRNAIDLSSIDNPQTSLQNQMSTIRQPSAEERVIYLSMAKCNLTQIPQVFNTEDNIGRRLADTTEYISFYGNNFSMVTTTYDQYDSIMNASKANVLVSNDDFMRQKMSSWSFGFEGVIFQLLKELDLRACSIQVLGDLNFQGMPGLTNLYLGENNIYYINANAFNNLKNLKHLDLSRNYRYDENDILGRMEFENINILQKTNLESLDLSFTRLKEGNLPFIARIGKSLQTLSICYSGIAKLRDYIFEKTSLRYLDVSGNVGALSSGNVLKGTEETLQVLYAEEVTLRNMRSFENFTNLEVLKISYNSIRSLTRDDVKTLKKLQILDLDNNRLSAWFDPFVVYMPELKILSIRNNNINLISEEMFADIQKLSYISLSGNFMICNCYARDLYECALKNEWKKNNTYVEQINDNNSTLFHNGYNDYNRAIHQRINISEISLNRKECETENSTKVTNFLILDYQESLYHCLLVPDSVTLSFSEMPSCKQQARDLEINDIIQEGWNKLYLILLVPIIIVPVSLFVYSFRKNFKYFLITMRNSAMLSLINKKDHHDENAIYNYDVFVSYCNEDRAWLLDHLLPHLENDCNISVCLHERDFQVGLSILENIVSCMDRSRLIMLVLSKQFLLSQWCQFEMHLAQHRLLETRREDLILILLEDIPRRLRPNTLHYLMVTKTYIVWPKLQTEQTIFWRRMEKSLVTQKLKQTEQNVSLA